MRVVIQRVRRASVSVDGVVLSEIREGLLVLLGVGHEDDRTDIDYLVSNDADLIRHAPIACLSSADAVALLEAETAGL